MRWCGCKIGDHGAANRIFLRDPWRSRPWVHSRFSTNLRQSFLQSLRDDSPWERFRLNTPISLRFRVKLICIFSADHENVVTENWLPKCLSRPSKAVDGWENIVDYTQFLMFVRPSASWASAYNSFFCWDRAAFFGRTRGREYSNLKSLKEKTSTKT